MKKITTFDEAIRFLDENKANSRTFQFGELFLKRAQMLLGLLGNPQNKMKVIHVAGTSGKGSTAYFISILLRSLGFSVGLNVKPHIEDIRERFQINNTYVSEEDFIHAVGKLIPTYHTMEKSKLGPPSYFEMTVAIAFLLFQKAKVDYAVMETGMGGTYDATNTVTREDKIVVLTKIGFDHTRILGKTLSKIASQKVGIIQPNNVTFSLSQKPQVINVFNNFALKKSTKIKYIVSGKHFSHIRPSPMNTTFNLHLPHKRMNNVEIGLLGSHQVENVSIALAVVDYLSRRNSFLFQEDAVRKALSQSHFAGRMETFVQDGKTIIVDGAHNPQKMRAFLNDLKKIYPHRKFYFLIGFREGKDAGDMLRYIVPLSKHLVLSSFHTEHTDWTIFSEKPEKLAKLLKKRDFNNFEVIEDCKKAFEEVVNKLPRGQILVVTGSLYLISVLYDQLKD